MQGGCFWIEPLMVRVELAQQCLVAMDTQGLRHGTSHMHSTDGAVQVRGSGYWCSSNSHWTGSWPLLPCPLPPAHPAAT
jgi:hypothetical protein